MPIDWNHLTPLASLAGPALVALASGSGAAGLFVIAMPGGMLLHETARAPRRPRAPPA